MTDKEFEHLKYEIESLMYCLEQKQQEYIKETGKEYMPPVRLNGFSPRSEKTQN